MCAEARHGQSGMSMGVRDGLGGAARARESQDGFVYAGGSHGEPTRARDCSGVAAEDGWATANPHLSSNVFVVLVFIRKDAFRRALLSWPKGPLGQSNRPLSLSFKNELIW